MKKLMNEDYDKRRQTPSDDSSSHGPELKLNQTTTMIYINFR